MGDVQPLMGQPKDVERLRAVSRRMEHITGSGGVSVTVDAASISIHGHQRRSRVARGPRVRMAWVTAVGSEAGAYLAEEVEPTAAGAWAAKPSGLAWDGTDAGEPEIRHPAGRTGLEGPDPATEALRTLVAVIGPHDDQANKTWQIAGVLTPVGALSPQDLSYPGEHSEAVATDTGYDPAEPPADTDGVKLTLLTGVAYYDAGDETLYCYARDLTLPAWLAPMLSAERRVVVDVPEDC